MKEVAALRYFAIERDGIKMNLHEQVEIDQNDNDQDDYPYSTDL